MDPNSSLSKWEFASTSPLSLSNSLHNPLSLVQHKAFEAEASVSQSYPMTSTEGSGGMEGRRTVESGGERESVSHPGFLPVSPQFTPMPHPQTHLFTTSLSLTSSPAGSPRAIPHIHNTSQDREGRSEEKAKAAVLKRKRIHIEPNGPVLPERRTWTDIKKGEGEGQDYKSLRCAEPGVFFHPRKDLYQVSTFIPKASFLDTDLVGLANLTQKLIIDLPSVKMIELTLKAHESFADFLIQDGYGTGCILRSQRNKVLLRIHTHEYYVSQGDSFFLPTGNSLSIANTAERLSVLLQLVLIKCP